jgi:hypothetical protein
MYNRFSYVFQSGEKAVETYLSNNAIKVEQTSLDSYFDFKLPSKDLNNKVLFLTGETHSIAANYSMKFQFLKYLNNKAGVKYLLIETPYSAAMLINNYLESGDKKYLREYFLVDDNYKELYKNTYMYSKEEEKLYTDIYDYNKNLSEDKRIKIFGINHEPSFVHAIPSLKNLLPTSQAQDSIRSSIEKFKVLSINSPDLMQYIILLNKNMKENEKAYKEFLGDKFFDFEIVLTGLSSTVEMINSVKTAIGDRSPTYGELAGDFSEGRESIMYENFKKIYNHYGGKYYGQFGSAHVSLVPYGNNKGAFFEKSFSNRLNEIEDSPIKQKVLLLCMLIITAKLTTIQLHSDLFSLK